MKKNSKSGAALMVALVFMIVCALIASGFFSLTSNTRKWSHRELCREQAFFVAEAGVESAAQNIATNNTIPYIGALVHGSGTVDGNAFAYSISSVSNQPFVYAISSTGTASGVRRAIHVNRVEDPSWARYALWMAVNGVIYFIGGERFYGPVHSNDKIYFQMSGGDGAKFYDSCSSSASSYGGSLDGTYFAMGLQLNAVQGAMADVRFSELLTAAQANGLVLTGTTAVTFNGNQARITNPRRNWTNYNYSVTGEGLIFVRIGSGGATNTRPANVSIGGRLDGRLTIVTEDSFYVTNHVTYTEDPRTNSASNDSLGLIAADDCWIATNAPNNLNLYSAILATGLKTNADGSFGVINYNIGSPRGNLNVYGSIVQDVRGAVGQFNSDGLTHGFAKNYSYDTRFSSYPPPYYPRVGNLIATRGWWEESVP